MADNLLKVNTQNVRVMRVVDMYVMKGMNPSLFGNYKFLKTYFKLQTVDKGVPKLLTVIFDVPTADILSKRVFVGANILVEKFGDDSIKYLGAEGDWETMIHFGYPTKEVGILPDKFKNFSEEVKSSTIEYFESEDTLKVEVNGNIIGILEFNGGAVSRFEYSDPLGKRLLKDWLESRGYKSRVIDEGGKLRKVWER